MRKKALKNKKILIIEDEVSISRALADILTQEGFNVSCTEDGKEGLAAALRENPGLILLDILLPYMDGITMLKALRRDKRGKEIPVVILTNVDNNERVAEALEDGVKDYLVKTNFKLASIVERVKARMG